MAIISQVTTAMQTVLTTVADTAARASGFIKRRRKLSGASFVQTLVFGWLSNPAATLEELSQTAAVVGVCITPQAIEQRFTEDAAQMLEQVLEACVSKVISVDKQALPLLERFNGVYLQDSSWIALPDQLVDVWQGCGGKSSPDASVKIQLRWELLSGALDHLSLTDGKTHDRRAAEVTDSLPAGSLRLTDLGYFSLDELKQFSDEQIFWLTRIQAMCEVFDTTGTRTDLTQWLRKTHCLEVDQPIRLGVKAQLPCRLVGQRVIAEVANQRRRRLRKQAKAKGRIPSKRRLALAGWNLYATNIQAEKLSVKEAMVLARVRWQIELMFKLWKSYGYIDQWRSEKPWRILCEVYAKLIAMILQHWILLTGGWHYPKKSLVKASKVVVKHAFSIASALASGVSDRLIDALSAVGRCLSVGCTMQRRRKQPSTYQLLLAVIEP